MTQRKPAVYPMTAVIWDDPRHKTFLTLEPYRSQFYVDGTLYQLEVPEGFFTDIASVPRWLFLVYHYRSFGPYPINHDFLYVFNGKVPTGLLHEWRGETWVVSHRVFTRAEVDLIFLNQMQLGGHAFHITAFDARNAYLAVKYGAQPRWDLYTRQVQA